MSIRNGRKGGGAARHGRSKDKRLGARHGRPMRFESLEDRLALHTEAVIAEVMFQPLPATAAELSGVPDATSKDFEYLELLNPSPFESLSLLDVQLVGDIQFQVPDLQLAPGELAVVVANTNAFAARYGDSIRVLGQWQGELPDGSLQIGLIGGDGDTTVDLQLANGSLWPARAHGVGSSLELTRPGTTITSRVNKPSAWQPSFQRNGTPGGVPSFSRGVMINEVIAGFVSSDSVSDQVELFNASDESIDISGWSLGNAAEDPQQYEFPEGTVIESGAFLVLSSSDFNPTPLAPRPGDFELDSLHGGTLYLTSPDELGQIDRFEDSVLIGSGKDVSWGRDRLRPEIIAPLLQPTLGSENATTVSGPALISEVNFNPTAPSLAAAELDPTLLASGLEFLEVYNPTEQTLDISGWSIGGSVQYVFSEETHLAPNEALVVVSFEPSVTGTSARELAFREHYGIDATIRLVGPYEGDQPDDYGQVTLLQPGAPSVDDPDFTPRFLRDEARYDDVPPWPAGADGNGLSLNRSESSGSGQLADAWVAQAPSPGTTPEVTRPEGLLPDLTFWVDPLLGINYFDFLDEHPRNGRRIMRFSTAVRNVGQGPLIVTAGDIVDDERQVSQVVENSDGSTSEFAAGQYVFHPTHGHVHFSDYVQHALYDVADDGGVGVQVAGGEKVSFCLLDLAPVDTGLPGTPQFPAYAACEGQTQGISVGWADIYASNLDDQWIEIEDLPAGEYWFESRVDPFNLLLESDESNNVIRHKIVLGVPQYDPDYLDAEGIDDQRLGTGDKRLSQLSIHRPGDVDKFRWVAPADGTLDVDLAFDRSQGDIDLYVWGTDRLGRVELVSAETDGDGEQASIQVLADKSYFVVVRELSGDTNPAYELAINGPDIERDLFEPNNSVLEPTNLGSANIELRDLSIHDANDQDFFVWTAPESATLLVDLQFRPGQGNLDLFVHDFATNQVLSSRSNTGRELLEIDVGQGRTYAIIVSGRDGDMHSRYDLTVDLLNISIDPLEPNDSYDAPADLGAGDQDLADLNVHKPFNQDFYRWQAPDDGTAIVDLLFAHSEGDLNLVLWEDGESVAASSSATDDEQIAFPVIGGRSYVLEVRGRNGATNPNYSLSIDGPDLLPDRFEPNGSIADATNLPGGDVSLEGLNIHESFDSDYFLWTPVASGVVLVDLLFQQSEGDLDLVLWADDDVVQESTTSDDNERLFVYVDADRTYALEVFGKNADINPRYKLRIDGPELRADRLEPNDTFETAVDVGRGDLLLTGLNVDKTDDSDFFRWTSPARGTSVFDLQYLLQDGDLDLAIWVNGEVTLVSEQTDDNERIVVDVEPNETIVLEVFGKNEDANLRYGLLIDGPNAPQVTSIQVAKASAPEQWRSLVAGDGTLQSIPWLDWQRIRLKFSSDVDVQRQDLSVTSASGAAYEIGEFQYDASAFEATWTLATFPAEGQLTLTLSDNVTDANSNRLDGDEADAKFPSGDGRPGGDFTVTLAVVPGDFVSDGTLDEADINALASAIRQNDPLFDLDGDGQSTTDDILVLVQDLIGSNVGDANLDGIFDSSDLVLMFAAGEFLDPFVGNSTWATGDFNGDGEFDSSDIVFALQFGSYVV